MGYLRLHWWRCSASTFCHRFWRWLAPKKREQQKQVQGSSETD
jgi:hypothetical protein